MINVDTSFLNDPAYKAAGWSPNTAEIKRTYSPPIPTSGTSEYFQAPPRSARLRGPSFGDDDEEVGLATGGGGAVGSGDTVGPAPVGRRRRRKEQLEEDDSSDLSDESNDEGEGQQRPANQIRFAKMPVRTRADSSPARRRADSSPARGASQQNDGPSLFVTSPSRPPDSQRLRRGSLGAIEAVKARARRDTATSSDISSEGDLDPSVFKRKQIHAGRSGRTLGHQIKEEEGDSDRPSTAMSEVDGDDGSDAVLDDRRADEEEEESDGDSLASGFSETVNSNSLLRGVGPMHSSPLAPMKVPSHQGTSPRRNKPPSTDVLHDLPPPRPISTVIPISALAAQIKAKNKKPTSPFDRFTSLSGANAPDPLYIKLYWPSSKGSEDPIEMQLRKVTNDGAPVTVADAIGLSLCRYAEEEYEPRLGGPKLDVNRWTLRIVEDGEVDPDFAPLVRTRPISDFTSNNNRPQRGRARDKPWDEFALVEASEDQFRENEELTPSFSEDAGEATTSFREESSPARASTDAASTPDSGAPPIPPKPNFNAPTPPSPLKPKPTDPSLPRPPQNPITDSRFALSAFRKDTTTALDRPPGPAAPEAAPRTGATRTLNIHFTDPGSLRTHLMPLDVTTDTYISEVFDQACARLNLDKALYVLRVTNTTTVAPTDRTVEALGPHRSDLDLTRRRFISDGAFPLAGSPGSSSPNAPLLLTDTSPSSRGAGGAGRPSRHAHAYRKQPSAMGAGTGAMHPLAQRNDLLSMAGLSAGLSTRYKRYNVVRKQPMSFAPSHPRTLLLDTEYLHIMPGDPSSGLLPSGGLTGATGFTGATGGGTSTIGGPGGGKTHIVPFSSVIGCKVNRKHPKTFRVVVFRQGQSKTWDFEAGSSEEAREIVGEIEAGVAPFREVGGVGVDGGILR